MAKIVHADGSTNFLRRFSEGDRKVGWIGRTVRYEVVTEATETQARGIVSADAEELRRVAEVTDTLRRETVDKGRMVSRMPNELSRWATSMPIRPRPTTPTFTGEIDFATLRRDGWAKLPLSWPWTARR